MTVAVHMEDGVKDALAMDPPTKPIHFGLRTSNHPNKVPCKALPCVGLFLEDPHGHYTSIQVVDAFHPDVVKMIRTMHYDPNGPGGWGTGPRYGVNLVTDQGKVRAHVIQLP